MQVNKKTRITGNVSIQNFCLFIAQVVKMFFWFKGRLENRPFSVLTANVENLNIAPFIHQILFFIHRFPGRRFIVGISWVKKMLVFLSDNL